MNDEESSEYYQEVKKIVDNVLGYPDEVAALKSICRTVIIVLQVFREYSKNLTNAYENGMINLYKYNYELFPCLMYIEIFKGMSN